MASITSRRRLATLAIWVPVALVAAWAIIRLAGLDRGFPLVAMIAYTPYIAVAAAVVALAAALARRWAAAAVAAAVAVALIALLLPRAFADGDGPDATGPHLTVMAANLKLGEADAEAVVDLVRDAEVDVLALQELTTESDAALRAAGIEELLPESVVRPEPGSSGTGIYARATLRGTPPSAPSAGGFFQAEATVEVPDADPLALTSVHPHPPTGQPAADAWRDDLEGLPAATPDGELRVLAGDFNATLDHAALRDVLDTGYRDAADVSGDGLSPTWPSDGLSPPLTIDHVLADERIAIEATSVHEIPGSDHRAVVADLVLPAAAPP